MELKEAIEELEDLQYQYENLGMMSEKNYTSIAIETVLQALEELQKESNEYKEAYSDYQELGKEYAKLQDEKEYIAFKIRLIEGDLEILEKHSINKWYNHFAYIQESVAVANLRNRINDIQELLKGE